MTASKTGPNKRPLSEYCQGDSAGYSRGLKHGYDLAQREKLRQAPKTEPERAQFEAWAQTDDGNCSKSYGDLDRKDDGEYILEAVEHDWLVWQAARASNPAGVAADVKAIMSEAEKARIVNPKCEGDRAYNRAVTDIQSMLRTLVTLAPATTADVEAIKGALDYAHDCAANELQSAQQMYGQYPRDGLGRHLTRAEEQVEEVKKAVRAVWFDGVLIWIAPESANGQSPESSPSPDASD